MKLKKILLYFFIAFIVSALVLLAHWHYRENPNFNKEEYDYEILSELKIGHHNAFTDLIFWHNKFYLIFRIANSHVDHNSILHLYSSNDCKSWDKIKEFKLPEYDIRDPKMAVINNKLFIYALENDQYPFVHVHKTLYSFTSDGVNFSELKDITPTDWMLWRPKQLNDSAYYAAAVQEGYQKSALFNSDDGINWSRITELKNDILHNEFAIQPTQDTLLGIVRIEGKSFTDLLLGSTNQSAIGYSVYPYTKWNFTKTSVTKLDGPYLFNYKGRVFALGRFEPFDTGHKENLFARKRTSIFELKADTLIHLADLPSSGDTGYSGAVIKDSSLYISYYSNDFSKDYPWLLGQFKETKVYILKIKIEDLLNNNFNQYLTSK